MESPQDDWREYRRLVLAELQRLSDLAAAIQKDVGSIKSDLAVTRTELNMKAGIWGAIAGFIPAASAAVYIMVKGS